MDTSKQKYEKLSDALQNMGCLAIAFSGGVDSTFLLKAATEILGPDAVVALTVQSPIMAPDEIRAACEFCRELGVRHILVDAGGHLNEPAFVDNPPDRCYHCKKKIFTELGKIVDLINSNDNLPKAIFDPALAASDPAVGTRGTVALFDSAADYPADASADPSDMLCDPAPPSLRPPDDAGPLMLADGTNLDDMNDYRPGMLALEELGIISPLKDAGFTKAEIREELRSRGMKIWNKPACACLASRVPYGQSVTAEKMAMIYAAENALHQLGFTQVRVRCHSELAAYQGTTADAARSDTGGISAGATVYLGRIEVLPDERKLFFSDEMMEKVSKIMSEAGFTYSALDLRGYIMGNMNRF